MLVTAIDGDGRVWLSNGLTRIHVANVTNKVTDDQTLMRDTVWISGAEILSSLVDPTIRRVHDLDARSVPSTPTTSPAPFRALEKRVEELAEGGRMDPIKLAPLLPMEPTAAVRE